MQTDGIAAGGPGDGGEGGEREAGGGGRGGGGASLAGGVEMEAVRTWVEEWTWRAGVRVEGGEGG